MAKTKKKCKLWKICLERNPSQKQELVVNMEQNFLLALQNPASN